MKIPRIDQRDIVDWLLRRGERLGAVVVALLAALLLWRGFGALRSLSVTDKQRPSAIDDEVAKARAAIDREPEPPAEFLTRREPLANLIDPWRSPLVPWKTGSSARLVIADSPRLAALNNPLFEEFARRSRPDVLPVEDLRAVAGVAILPPAAPAMGPGGAMPGPDAPSTLAPIPPALTPPGPGPGPGPGPARRPPRGGDPLGQRPDPLNPAFAQPIADAPVIRGRIVPYVIVTGLIPVAKQKEEYRRRFESVGFRDTKRDSPRWSDFEIDRGVVGPDGKETWSRIDLAAALAQQSALGGRFNVETVPVEFRLDADENKRSKETPADFCSPLPTRLDGSWELADLHPWVVDRWTKLLSERAAMQPGQDQLGPGNAGPASEGPGFDDTAEQLMEPAVQEPKQRREEFCLFRFVDTAVQPGRSYRYRVRLKVWNPNYSKDPEVMRPHVTDPALAVEPKITSPDAATTAAATVPDTTRILVGTLRPDEIKDMRLRAGMLEVLVMAPDEQTGAFSLRGLVGEPGVPIDINEKLNARNQRDRARGPDTVSGRLLVDARGRQEDRRGTVPDKGKPPADIPEPFDILCMRDDGSFELVSLAESERDLQAYGPTLPPRAAKPKSREPVGADTPRGEPVADPLAGPGRGP